MIEECMIDLPYKRKFDSIPEVDVDELVNYFNLEFGVSNNANKFSKDDFKYLGIFEVDSYEGMYWEVKGQDICATVRPFEDTYIIEMDKRPEEL
jgi:hypothetical protein